MESDDFLWQHNSPTQQPDNHNNYVFRLRFDGDVWDVYDKECENYEDAVDELKRALNNRAEFYVCVIEEFEVDFHDVRGVFTLDKNEYITKVGRYLQLEASQFTLTSDEVVEKNQLRTYLNFNL